MCGLNPDEEFSRAVTRISRWIDRRRPRYLNDAERALVEKDPELQAAIRWRVELETQCDDRPDDPEMRAILKDQGRKVNNLRRRLQDRRRKEARREFSRKQAVVDIEKQLTGGAVSDEPVREVLRKEFTMPPEQILLVETFLHGPLQIHWKMSGHDVIELLLLGSSTAVSRRMVLFGDDPSAPHRRTTTRFQAQGLEKGSLMSGRLCHGRWNMAPPGNIS